VCPRRLMAMRPDVVVENAHECRQQASHTVAHVRRPHKRLYHQCPGSRGRYGESQNGARVLLQESQREVGVEQANGEVVA